MKTSRSTLRLLGNLLLLPLLAFSQGSLTPPGPPGPTMKTLTQVEPRTIIDTVPYVITTPGSYYLTGDLTGTASQDAITVTVGGVTIDLMGFTLSAAQNGIIGAGIGAVVVKNGAIKNCSANGIDLQTVEKCHIEHILACDNGATGISVGPASIVHLCTTSGNRRNGITAADGSAIFNCVSQKNGAQGIDVASRCRVAENVCDSNASSGINTSGRGSRIEANTASLNTTAGYQVNGSENLVIKNSACDNGTDYQIGAGNNFGQIVVGAGPNFVNSNPWANFACRPEGPGGCASDTECNDNNPCTTDRCQGGVCQYTPIPNCGAVCGNGMVEPGEACDDGNTISGDGCSATCAIENQPCQTAMDCNDNSACTTDTCQMGICQHTAVVCVDNNPCTTDTCDPAVGCRFAAAPNGLPCPNGTCQNGTCTPTAGCTDGIKNGNETDVDCGGSCPPCSVGQMCSTNNDCASGLCQNGFCQQACPDADNDGYLSVICGGFDCDDADAHIHPGASETCNGVDDDCDGTIDEDSGTITCGTGACQRTIQACQNGVPQTCIPGSASAETCNSIDDDCDGSVDENLGFTSCGAGACQRTVANCVNGSPQTCVAGTPSPEVCNGIDDNCDGQVDNGNPGGGMACATGLLGTCSMGTTTCQNGVLVCSQNQQPSAELCNGQDDNCNGQTDEGDPGGGVACNTGLPGACAAGTQHCVNGSLACIQNSQASSEACNGVDDNCNGQTDENLGTITCGTGACQRTVQACMNGQAQVCTPGPASNEICGNAIDDDCDGVVDDGCIPNP